MTCKLLLTAGRRKRAAKIGRVEPRELSEVEPTGTASPLAEAVGRVGDRWTLLVIEALLGGSRRFNELVDDLPGIAPNILSQRLKHLEGEALVVARPYSRRPPRVAYELTGAGLEHRDHGGGDPPVEDQLAGALRLLAHWGARRSDAAEAPRHGLCGTALEVRWYCPTCERPVEDSDEAELRYL